MRYGCNLVKDSSNDVIDFDATIESFKSTIQPIDPSFYSLKESTAISDQGSLGSCVANATCDAFEILMGIEEQSIVQLSRLFVYWNARLFTKSTHEDKGSVISLAMQSLIDYGVCREEEWQYDVNRVFNQPSLLAYKEGDDNRAKNFYKIRTEGDQLIQSIHSALQLNHPVVFGCPVGQELEDYPGGDVTLDSPTVSLGNHALIIVGADESKERFLIRNSWGEGWGNVGHGWFSYQYITKSAQDLHVVTKMYHLL